MVKEFKSLSLLNILPENIKEDPKIIAAASALDAELQAITADIKENLLISRIDYLPENVLDLLAWQWHVDFYKPFDMSIEVKRKLIRESIAWHRIKGTKAAVELVAGAVYGNVKVEEWYEYGGKPYTFRITVGGDGFDETHGIETLMRVIDSAKNTRSWLDGKDESGITVSFSVEDVVKYGFASTFGGTASIDIARPGENEDVVFPCIIDALTGTSGKRKVGAGPADLIAKLGQASAFAYTNAGTADIQADLNDLPEWIRSITDPSHIWQALGFTYDCKGRQRIPLAAPQEGSIEAQKIILSGVGGNRVCGLATPETSLVCVRIGHIEALTGRGCVPHDSRDIATYIDGILKPTRITPSVTLRAMKSGRRGVSPERPDNTGGGYVIGNTYAITGRIVIGADRSDLPPNKRMRAHVGIMQVGLSAVG